MMCNYNLKKVLNRNPTMQKKWKDRCGFKETGDTEQDVGPGLGPGQAEKGVAEGTSCRGVPP